MSKSEIRLITKSDDAAYRVRTAMKELLYSVTEENYTAMACVLIKNDGANFVSTTTNGNRVLLLGAITDMQYTVAKDGDG